MKRTRSGQTRRDQDHSRNVKVRLDQYPLVALAPLDAIGIGLGVLAVAELSVLRIAYFGSTEWPTLFDEAYGVMMAGMIGLVGLFMIRLIVFFSLHKKEDSRESRKQSRGTEALSRGSIIGAPYSLRTGEYFILSSAIYFLFIMIVSALKGFGIFQVVAGDVYAVYLSSAVCEELFYRGLIVMGLQLLLACFAFLISRGKDERFLAYLGRTCYKDGGKRKIFTWYNTFCMIFSGLVFAGIHLNYWSQPDVLVLTFAGGFSQSYWYIRSNCLLVVEGSHALVNFTGARGVIQGMQSPISNKIILIVSIVLTIVSIIYG